MNRVAIYLRLSLEDKKNIFMQSGSKDESNSIGNQRKQILEYLHNDNELSQYEVVEFCDDGYSGTNMERPAMQKLLKEIKTDNIGCIIVKDMSRFSRDYIEMGTYLNKIFPFMGVRFIALNDNYDSRKQYGRGIEIDTAFQTLLYDLYSKDISLKVKTSFENKCANGEYIFGQVPFGYEKSGSVKNSVVVNEKEADIVRYIFSLAMQGRSSTQIAKQLYDEKIPTITQMRRAKTLLEGGKVHTWSSQAVRNILNNRFYIGEMAYGKTVRKSVGSKRKISVPQKDWNIIPNHHEALITEEIFEQVSIFGAAMAKNKNKKKHPLAGKLYCGGCGYSMNYKPLCGNNRYRHYECRKHALLQIPECCTYISADSLEKTLLLMLKNEMMFRGDIVKQRKNLISFQKAYIYVLKKKLAQYRQEIRQIQAQKDNLYERYALKEFSVGEYQKKSKNLTDKLDPLCVLEEEEKKKLDQILMEYQDDVEDMRQVIQYFHIEELTGDVVNAFIKKVNVYKGKKIEVEWNFSNNLP